MAKKTGKKGTPTAAVEREAIALVITGFPKGNSNQTMADLSSMAESVGALTSMEVIHVCIKKV